MRSTKLVATTLQKERTLSKDEQGVKKQQLLGKATSTAKRKCFHATLSITTISIITITNISSLLTLIPVDHKGYSTTFQNWIKKQQILKMSMRIRQTKAAVKTDNETLQLPLLITIAKVSLLMRL